MRDKREEEWERQRWKLEARIFAWEEAFNNISRAYTKALEDKKRLEEAAQSVLDATDDHYAQHMELAALLQEPAK